VIHSFFVPAFRIKRDVLPGRFTTVWFEATQPGAYHLFCAEYCGTEHSHMIGSVIAMEPWQYQDWLSLRPLDLAEPVPESAGQGAPARSGAEGETSLSAQGEALFQSLDCNSCHLAAGGGAGPSLAGLFGREVELAGGETIVADAEYIRRSIMEPNAHVVAGFSPIMPTYEGQISEEELAPLVEYIRSLGEGQGNNEL
jgi:cytochrome c oxidase subunit 2